MAVFATITEAGQYMEQYNIPFDPDVTVFFLHEDVFGMRYAVIRPW